MALVLSLRKGHGFTVGGVSFVVSATEGLPSYVTLRRGDSRLFDVGSNWVFVSLGVRIRVGVPRSATSKVVSLAIDAPGLPVVRTTVS